MSHSHAVVCHAVVWVDSNEARVFHFNAEDVERLRIHAHDPFRKVEHKAGAIGAGRQHLDLDFFDHIANALRGTRAWLLVGPGAAKEALVAHLDRYMPQLRAQLVAIEAMDRPTDSDLLDRARRICRNL